MVGENIRKVVSKAAKLHGQYGGTTMDGKFIYSIAVDEMAVIVNEAVKQAETNAISGFTFRDHVSEEQGYMVVHSGLGISFIPMGNIVGRVVNIPNYDELNIGQSFVAEAQIMADFIVDEVEYRYGTKNLTEKDVRDVTRYCVPLRNINQITNMGVGHVIGD